LAISTAWNYAHAKNGSQIIEEIKKLGFGQIELNFSLERITLEEILGFVKQGEIKVSSVHNFCPIPEGLAKEIALPDYYNLASFDETERQKAVFFTKKTIDTAKGFAAEAVVLHCGRNEIYDSTRKLIVLYQKGLKDSAQFQEAKIEMRKARKKVAQKHFAQALKSLKELANYAKDNNIALGIENRFYWREIPSLDEVGIILEKFKKYPVYYWHDTGHARIFEDLGFVRQNAYLDLYYSKMLGRHLH
ncbi:MAG: sugar phosphate isomerase/epimerase, partial [Candidatus Omnitrophica bacterium]|nr:sugar phosphate isomerase/epimerase [Candidatus Omnitrophota bacterium]